VQDGTRPEVQVYVWQDWLRCEVGFTLGSGHLECTLLVGAASDRVQTCAAGAESSLRCRGELEQAPWDFDAFMRHDFERYFADMAPCFTLWCAAPPPLPAAPGRAD